MRHLVLAGALAAVLCADGVASRKFVGWGYLDYNSELCELQPCSPFVTGATSFGVSAWVKRSASTGDRVIVSNQTLGDGFGFLLFVDDSNGPGDPNKIVFRYRYLGSPLAPPINGQQKYQTVSTVPGPTVAIDEIFGQPIVQEISVSASLAGIDFQGPVALWFHVAADLDMATGTARLFLNGEQKATTTGFPLSPALGALDLSIGGASGANGFIGDIHDVCIVAGLWTAETALMGACVLPSLCMSARDAVEQTATATLRFNARLRQSPQDMVNSVQPQLVPPNATLIQGMGPPLTYADQPDTVLVIGDTQFLDFSEWSQNPETSVEMKKLGKFVRDYRDSLRISAVFHVGDWVNSGGAEYWEMHRARALANKLNEACIPWACTLGNHDYAGGGTPIPPYIQHFSSQLTYTMPTTLFKEPPCPENWFGVQMTDWPAGSPDLHADEAYAHSFNFEMYGQPQLGITIPYLPSNAILQWAKDTANAPENAGKPVWLTTHNFLNYLGNQTPEARYWWDNYIQFIPNLRFIFSGHWVLGSAYLAHHRCDGIYDLKPVHQLIVNGQQAPGGGQGFLQILGVTLGEAGEFSSANVESYIPLEDRFLATDSDHEFTLGFPPCGQDCNNNGLADRYDIHSGASADVNANDVPDECEGGLSAGGSQFDLDHDGIVGVTDLLIVLRAWGTGPGQAADFDSDGMVGLTDLVALLGAWGQTS